MIRYQYILLYVDLGDLAEVNRFAEDGWRVVAFHPLPQSLHYQWVALLEKPLADRD